MRRAVLPSVLLVLCSVPAAAQTVGDGVMVNRHDLLTGNVYSRDTWDKYWEGARKRDNGNIGTLTTQSNVWTVNYGVADRLNVIAMVPHVWTHASQGVLHGMSGFQDLTIAGKYAFVDKPSTSMGALRAIGVVAAGLPLTDYTPDFFPMSIGTASRRLSGRGTLHLQASSGWFATGSGSYTWRAHVTLDRPYYFTDGRLFLTSDVDMPNVTDYVASTGYMKRGRMYAVSFSQQRTLGGGDIRRQDAPFVSNRMNFSRLGATVMRPVPKLEALVYQLGVAYVIDGRNVGQSTTFTVGLRYQVLGRTAR